MDVKRRGAVVHVVFPRSETTLMAGVSASVHLTVIILFTLPGNTESLNSLIFFFFFADLYLEMYLLS